MSDAEAPQFIEGVDDGRIPGGLTPEEVAVFIGTFNQAMAEYASDGNARRQGLQACADWRLRHVASSPLLPPAVLAHRNSS